MTDFLAVNAPEAKLWLGSDAGMKLDAELEELEELELEELEAAVAASARLCARHHFSLNSDLSALGPSLLSCDLAPGYLWSLYLGSRVVAMHRIWPQGLPRAEKGDEVGRREERQGAYHQSKPQSRKRMLGNPWIESIVTQVFNPTFYEVSMKGFLGNLDVGAEEARVGEFFTARLVLKLM